MFQRYRDDYGQGHCLCPDKIVEQRKCHNFQKASMNNRCMFQKPGGDICDWHPDYTCVTNPPPAEESNQSSGWGTSYPYRQTQGAKKEFTPVQSGRIDEMQKLIDEINKRSKP